MKRFLRRFFPGFTTDSGDRDRGRTHTRDKATHHGIKTPHGQGPFLLSCDGRVIPLRKAPFLRRR
jgi:hypothetical protein